jgi:hypothetical protein
MLKVSKFSSSFPSFVTMVLKKKYEKTNLKIHLFIPFRANSKPIFILLGQNNIKPYSCPL